MARKSTKNTSVNEEVINEQIVEETTEDVITPEEEVIEDASEAPEGVEDGTIIETKAEEVVEETTENTIGEEIGNILAEENNKKFEEVKRKHLTNQMIGFLWNGQEMDW